MKFKIIKWLAILLIVESGLLHYATAQVQYEKLAYLGYLAVGSCVLSFLAAVFINYGKLWGWVLGLLLAAGSIIGFVLTRTVALPGLAIEEWLYPYGIVGTIVESLFILLFFLVGPWKSNRIVVEKFEVVRPWRSINSKDIQPVKGNQPAASSKSLLLLPLSGIFLVFGGFYGTYQWDVYASETGYHQHVSSLSAVCSTPFTTFDELEQNYGLEVNLVALSVRDSIVDVRLKVTDPVKAQSLLENQAALLVNREVLVLAPHLHSHWRLKKDKVHVMFFPTQNKTVQTGSEVSLVFGRVRVEPVIVR